MDYDKTLKNLFRAQTPHFTDGDAFMASLAKRLDAVEFLKQYQERTIRRYKMVMVAAFVVGIISGAFTTVHLLSTPIDVPLFNFHVQTGFLVWLTENSRLLVAAALSLLMTAGICSIVMNIMDIIEIRSNLDKSYSPTMRSLSSPKRY